MLKTSSKDRIVRGLSVYDSIELTAGEMLLNNKRILPGESLLVLSEIIRPSNRVDSDLNCKFSCNFYKLKVIVANSAYVGWLYLESYLDFCEYFDIIVNANETT